MIEGLRWISRRVFRICGIDSRSNFVRNKSRININININSEVEDGVLVRKNHHRINLVAEMLLMMVGISTIIQNEEEAGQMHIQQAIMIVRRNSINKNNISITTTKLGLNMNTTEIGGRVAIVVDGEKGIIAAAVAVAAAERENEKIRRNESILEKVVVGTAENTTTGETIPMMTVYLEAVTMVLEGRKVKNTKSINAHAREMIVAKDKCTRYV